MANKIYASTSSVKVDLRIEKTGYNQSGNPYVYAVDWSSINCPEYVVSLTHTINGSGKANDLSLTLYHHMDPYMDDSRYGINYQNDAFGYAPNDPSYLLRLIAEGYGSIKIRYGYVYDSNINTAFSNDAAAKTTDWFTMYITDMTASFNPNGITYTITAVSTLAYDVNMMGGTVYDWWTDPQDKYRVVLNTSEANDIQATDDKSISEAGDKIVLKRIEGILRSIAQKAGYKIDCSPLYKGNVTAINFETTADFTQDANTPDMQFINLLLGKIIIYENTTFNPPKTYIDNQGYNQSVYNGYTWKRNWSVLINDATKKLTINYAFIDYTKGNLLDMEGRDISEFDEGWQDYYNVFLTEMNSNGTNIGSLFYNYPSFKRDMFDAVTQAIKKQDIFKGDWANLAPSGDVSYSVETDIISLDLQYPIIAGLAGAHASLYNTSTINSSGDEVSGGDCTFTATGEYNTSALFRMLNSQDFKKIMNRLYVSGSVTVPGLAKVVSMLSLVNIFVFISNKMDVTSGQYLILDQVDTITNGIFTTQLGVMKSRSFDNSVVYELADNSTANKTASDMITENKVYAETITVELNGNAVTSATLKKGKPYMFYVVANNGATASYGGFDPEILLYEAGNESAKWGEIVPENWGNASDLSTILFPVAITAHMDASISESKLLKVILKTGENTSVEVLLTITLTD